MDALPQVYHHENRVDSCPFFFVFTQKIKKDQWKKSKWTRGGGGGGGGGGLGGEEETKQEKTLQ